MERETSSQIILDLRKLLAPYQLSTLDEAKLMLDIAEYSYKREMAAMKRVEGATLAALSKQLG